MSAERNGQVSVSPGHGVQPGAPEVTDAAVGLARLLDTRRRRAALLTPRAASGG